MMFGTDNVYDRLDRLDGRIEELEERNAYLERLVLLLAESLPETPVGRRARNLVRDYMPGGMLPYGVGDVKPDGEDAKEAPEEDYED